MLLPLSWLKQFLPTLPPPNKLVETLAMHGLDIDNVIDRRGQYDKVVIGEIVGIKPHPNADKLQLVEVVTAPNGKPQEIVCGAPNIAVGQKVPVALLGAKLPSGLTIEPREIRGVKSNGMICAEDELGLGKDHNGILVLDQKLKVGAPFAKAMGFDDVVLDLATPANRADLMAVRGLAWEIGAILGKPVKFATVTAGLLPPPLHPSSGRRGQQVPLTVKSVSVNVANPKLCPVYTARAIRGVTVKPSPAWLQNRLRLAGMRPINAIVDATNYVMLEYGQPLHAFDALKVSGGQIAVRQAASGEKLLTLDGQERPLDVSMLVIADSKGPIALAGVMGGQESEVSERTKDIILESAIFDSVSIRKTSRKLGLMSEASKRFEKGLWPSLPEQASQAAATLIVGLCGGTVEQGSIRVGAAPVKPKTIRFSPKYVTERLGLTVSAARSKAILTKLGFKITGRATWKVTVPEWRFDVTIPEDLVDEVGRMVGYEKLPNSFPTTQPMTRPIPKMKHLREELADILVGFGLTEVILDSFYQPKSKQGPASHHFEILNPLDQAQRFLQRSSRTQVLFQVLHPAIDAGKNAAVFHFGRTFNPDLPRPIENQQPWTLTIGLAHKEREKYLSFSGLIEALEKVLKVVPGSLIDLFQKKENISDEMVEGSEAKGRKWIVAEIPLAAILALPKLSSAVEVNRFPSVRRDVSFWNVKNLNFQQVAEVAYKSVGKTLKQVNLLDEAQAEGKKSMTVSLTFQAPDRTLTKAEVDKLEAKIKAALVKLGAEIR